MSEKELKQLYFINIEIRKLEEDIEQMESSVLRSPCLDGMPRGSGTSDRVGKIATQLAFLKKKLELKRQELMLERSRIELFLDSIEDGEIRLIFRLRHINCMDWRSIGGELHRDHSWIRRKYNKYLGKIKKPQKPQGNEV